MFYLKREGYIEFDGEDEGRFLSAHLREKAIIALDSQAPESDMSLGSRVKEIAGAGLKAAGKELVSQMVKALFSAGMGQSPTP